MFSIEIVSLEKLVVESALNQDDRKKRIIQFLKNVWTARYWWLKKYKVDPPIISADQMPLHRNESSGQKTLNFSGRDQACFVKENNHLSRERCTVMTIVSSSKKRSPPPVEFVFKGAGKRVKVSPPEKIQVQWAEKGSYRLENMLTFIERLPTIPTAFAPQKRCIFTLDDYSAHLSPEVEAALNRKRYFLIVIGDGITGDVQVDDTAYHMPLKAAYRKQEMALMIDMLKDNPTKIPSPSRDQMMSLFQESWKETLGQVDNEHVFRTNMITLALDGSEDHLASQKLIDLVGPEMLQFREELVKSEAVVSLNELRKQMIKQEGVRYKTSSDPSAPPEDEGLELYDGDGVNLENDTTESGDETDEDDNTETSVIVNDEATPVVEDNTRLIENIEESNDNLKLLKNISAAVSEARITCSNTLLPF